MSYEEMERLASAAAEAISPILREMKGRVDALERRLTEAEGKALTYGGTFNRAVTFARNTITTHGGALWLAVRETTGETPGSGDANAWVLIQKSHR